jgi:hypothetical protein
MDTVAPVTESAAQIESTAQIETLKYRPGPGTQTTAPRDWLSFLIIWPRVVLGRFQVPDVQ